MVHMDLPKWTGRILKRIKSFWNCSQNVAKKIDVKEHHFLGMLQTAKNFQRFPHTLIKQLFFKTAFADLFRFMHLCVLLYIDFQKQSMDIALKILAKYLETVVGEFHFRVNLHGFSLPPVSIGKSFLQVGYLPPHRQNNFQNCFLLQKHQQRLQCVYFP